MALSREHYALKSSKELIKCQASIRGNRTASSKKVFNMIKGLLEERGEPSLDWDDYVPKKSVIDIDGKKVARCDVKITSNDVFGSKSYRAAMSDRSIDDKTREGLLLANKHLQIYLSAVSRGKDFDLSLADTKKLVTTKKCAYTGVTLDDNVPSLRPSTDRIDSSKGYVKGNVVTVSHKANVLKNELFENDVSKFKMSNREFLNFAASMINQMDDISK